MHKQSTTAASPSDDSLALAGAVAQSQDVKVRVEACAETLGSANSGVKQQIVRGSAEAAAALALTNIVRVETDVQNCADDLHVVNEALAQGVDRLRQTEQALVAAQTALAVSESALAAAQVGEKQARLEALHDSATGLPNREHFNSRLVHAIAQAKRHGTGLAVMFFDLDKFKAINDTHGHAAGDEVLQQVANRLLEHCRDEDMVCRNGGDEFLYLLMNPNGRENVARIATGVRRSLSRPIEIGNAQFTIDSSIGVSIYPDDGISAEDLVESADAAMYGAKKEGTGVMFFGREAGKLAA